MEGNEGTRTLGIQNSPAKALGLKPFICGTDQGRRCLVRSWVGVEAAETREGRHRADTAIGEWS